jgi:hypothetical protein
MINNISTGNGAALLRTTAIDVVPTSPPAISSTIGKADTFPASGSTSVTTGERLAEPLNILVSLVRSAIDKNPRNSNAAEIIEAIRTGSQFNLAAGIEHIRRTFKQVLAQTSDRKLAKEASGKMKKFLPAVLWSGTFLERSDKGLQQHSGLLCADWLTLTWWLVMRRDKSTPSAMSR